MANIKSAKKRVLVSAASAERNKAVRSKVKTYVKKVRVCIENGDKVAAQASLKAAVSEIYKARSRGVYHPNTAARKVSRLSREVGAMS